MKAGRQNTFSVATLNVCGAFCIEGVNDRIVCQFFDRQFYPLTGNPSRFYYGSVIFAVAFYESFGFYRSVSEALTLYQPISAT